MNFLQTKRPIYEIIMFVGWTDAKTVFGTETQILPLKNMIIWKLKEGWAIKIKWPAG